MKNVELTSKLVLAIIGLAAVSAILVPTYAVPTIRSADIVDGEVRNADLANNAVTSNKIRNGEVRAEDIADGVIPSGGVQPTVHTVRTAAQLAGHDIARVDAICPDGEILTGGGFTTPSGSTIDVVFLTSQPESSNWVVVAQNIGDGITTINAVAVCMDFSP